MGVRAKLIQFRPNVFYKKFINYSKNYKIYIDFLEYFGIIICKYKT